MKTIIKLWISKIAKAIYYFFNFAFAFRITVKLENQIKKFILNFFLRAKIRAHTQLMLNDFRSNNCYSGLDKSIVIHQLRHHSIRISPKLHTFTFLYNFVKETIFIAASITLLLFPYIHIKSKPELYRIIFAESLSLFRIDLNILFIVSIYFFVILAFFYLRGILLTSVHTEKSILSEILVYSGILTISVILEFKLEPSNILGVMISFSIFAIQVLSVAFFLISLLFYFSDRATFQIIGHSHPDSLFFYHILFLTDLIGKSKKLKSTKIKQEILRQLKRTAFAVEKYFPSFFSVGDSRIDVECKIKFIKIASDLRNMSNFVFGDDKKMQAICDKLKQYIILSANSDYDGILEIAVNNEIPLDHLIPTLPQKAISILKTILKASVPLLLIMIIKLIKIEIDLKIMNYMTIFSISWAFVSILKDIDPSFDKQINSMKDIFTKFSAM